MKIYGQYETPVATPVETLRRQCVINKYSIRPYGSLLAGEKIEFSAPTREECEEYIKKRDGQEVLREFEYGEKVLRIYLADMQKLAEATGDASIAMELALEAVGIEELAIDRPGEKNSAEYVRRVYENQVDRVKMVIRALKLF